MSLSIAERKLFSIKKTAIILGYSPSYISHLIAIGAIDFVLPPGRIHKRISKEGIEKFIKENSLKNIEDFDEKFWQQ